AVPLSPSAASNRNDFVNAHSLNTYVLSDAKRLMRLQAEPPLRMAQAILDRARRVLDHVRAVHRLQREPFEIEAGKDFRRRVGLRVDQLQLMAAADHEVPRFGADANPVQAIGRIDGAIGLDADREAARMQR